MEPYLCPECGGLLYYEIESDEKFCTNCTWREVPPKRKNPQGENAEGVEGRRWGGWLGLRVL